MGWFWGTGTHREPCEGDARLAWRPPPRVPPLPQDGILFGAVGAYDWDGAVLEESRRGRIVPPREAFEPEFPLELKNHAAYLGTGGGGPRGCAVPRGLVRSRDAPGGNRGASAPEGCSGV